MDIIAELDTLYRRAYDFSQIRGEMLQERQELLDKVRLLEKENKHLKETVGMLEKLGSNESSQINKEEKESLRKKIDTLIARIDSHLRS